MSLDDDERARTSAQLRANLALTGLTAEQVAADLGCTSEHVAQLLGVSAVYDPADVWQLRDYLVQAVRDVGRSPVAFTVLTEDSRRLASGWFRLRAAPRHDFSA